MIIKRPILSIRRQRQLGIAAGIAVAHLGLFAVMSQVGERVPLPAVLPSIDVTLFRPPPPPPPPPLKPAVVAGGGAPAAPSRIHVPPKPVDQPREVPAPRVPAPIPDPVVVGVAAEASATPGMGQGGTGTGTGTGDGEGDGPGSGGTGPIILRGASQAEIQSVFPEAARRARRGGGATVNCVIRADQRLEACRVVSESQRGLGFGEAGVRVASEFFRFRPPMTASGRPVEGQRVTVNVIFGRQAG